MSLFLVNVWEIAHGTASSQILFVVQIRATKSLMSCLDTLKISVVLIDVTSLTKFPLRILANLNKTHRNMRTFHAQIFNKLGYVWIFDDEVFWFVLTFYFAKLTHAIDGLYRNTSRHKGFILKTKVKKLGI